MKSRRVSGLAATGYLTAHACFACRQSFKRAPRKGTASRCPQCGGETYEMGRSFKAPARAARDQWAKVQLLYAHGFRFSAYRGHEGPALPGRLSEVARFLRENPKHPLRVAKPNFTLQPTPLRGAAERERSALSGDV